MIENQTSKIVKGIWLLIENDDVYFYTPIGDYAQIDGSDYIMNVTEPVTVDEETIQIHIKWHYAPLRVLYTVDRKRTLR